MIQALPFTALLLFSLQALALDTSGCSPMVEIERRAMTPGHGVIKADLIRPPRESCWNQNDSTLTIEYRFELRGGAQEPAVEFWISINGVSRTCKAAIRCNAEPSGTGASPGSLCVARAISPAPPTGSVMVEVAPNVGGFWDTAGYGQNTEFKF